MTVALAPPICGDDVPPALINKSIQKFISILVEKSKYFINFSIINESKSQISIIKNSNSNIQPSSSRYINSNKRMLKNM